MNGNLQVNAMKIGYKVIFTLVIGMLIIGFVSAEDIQNGMVGSGKGYYSISSNPGGASVVFDGVHKGTTPVTVEVSTSGSPGHTISLSKAGYQPWSTYEPGNPGDDETIYVDADLVFIPVTEPTTIPTTTIIGGGAGYFDITSNPDGGTVIFDGKNKGLTPLTVEVSSSGTPGHTISITKEGYQPWSQYYSGNPFEGETIHVDAELVFIPITIPTTPIGGEKGYFSVSSSPSGASVSFDGINQGTSPVTIEVSSTGTPGHTISVSMPGYQSWSQYYSTNPPAGSTVYVNAVLSPMYQNGNIQVMSSPSGAYAVLDNGQNSLVTPGTFSSVAVGWHNVRVTKSGYQPYSIDIQVNSAGTTPVSANLVPISQQGSISVSSTPSGAGLYIDTIYQGETNKVVGNLAAGTHTVTLRKSGYQTWSQQQTVYSGQTTYVNAQLTPYSSPLTGDLEVQSSPSGAVVYLDGNYQGSTSPGSPLDVTGLTPGTHALLLKKSGYQDYSTTTNIRSGQTTVVSANLIPSGQVSSTASVQISSDPGGADVLINNAYVGITPLTAQNVQPGSSTITISLPGYNSYTTTMQINAGQAYQVNAALLPVTTPTTKAPASPLCVMLALTIAGIIATLGLQRGKK